jgi:hypothetical protein
MGVEKIVIEDIRHLLETAVEVLHLQVLGRIFAGMTDGSEEKADHHTPIAMTTVVTSARNRPYCSR